MSFLELFFNALIPLCSRMQAVQIRGNKDIAKAQKISLYVIMKLTSDDTVSSRMTHEN